MSTIFESNAVVNFDVDLSLVMFCRLLGICSACSGATGRDLCFAWFLSVICSVVVFFVRSSSFENDVAGKTVLDGESELRLIEDVLLRSEVDFDRDRLELLLVFVLRHRRLNKAFRDLTKWL